MKYTRVRRMLSNARLPKIFTVFIQILTILALAELISARIIGRLAFLMMQNPVIALMYNIGVTLVWVVTIMTFIAFILLAINLMRLNDSLLIPVTVLLLAMIPIALFTPGYAYVTAAFLLLLVIIYTAKRNWESKGFTLTVLLIALVLLLGIVDLLTNAPPLFRYIVESSIIPASIAVYLFYRRMGRISLGGRVFSVALPLLVFIIPKSSASVLISTRYTMDIMPWVIRMVSAFSLGFLFLLPLEAYALALALVLLTIFRIRREAPLTACGLTLLITAGLPNWSIYPLLIATLGFLLITFKDLQIRN